MKKMLEEVAKIHKQCSAEILSAKKIGEEVSSEIAQGWAKLGKERFLCKPVRIYLVKLILNIRFTEREHDQSMKSLEANAENLLR